MHRLSDSRFCQNLFVDKRNSLTLSFCINPSFWGWIDCWSFIDMAKANNVNNLSVNDIEKFYNYLCDFELNHKESYGHFNFYDSQFQEFCKTNNIISKGKRGKVNKNNNNGSIWFKSKQNENKVNDVGHHLLRHVRNSIAHGLIKKKGQFYYFEDYSTNKTSQTMGGRMRSDLFWPFLNELIKTKK